MGFLTSGFTATTGGDMSASEFNSAFSNATLSGSILPDTDNSYDLGSSTYEFKNLYIDGTANIDSLVADTADINGGTVDAAAIGGTTPAAGAFTTLSATGALTSSGGIVNTGDLKNVAWTDYASSSTVVGWSSFTTKEIYYKKVGKLVFVIFRIEGASDSTAASFTLPYTHVGSPAQVRTAIFAKNDTTNSLGIAAMASATVNCYKSAAFDSWSTGASEDKYVYGQIWYEATT